jgi:hypothetical protein
MAVRTGQTYVNSRSGGEIRVLEHWDDTNGRRFRFERMLPPGTGKGEPHLHEDFTQVWEGVQGEAMIMVGGEERPLMAGQRVVLAPGTKHRDPWNISTADAIVRAQFEPVPEFIRAYTEAYVNRMQAGELNEQDEFSLMQILVIAHAYDGKSYGISPPVVVQRAFGPLGALIGRLRGYRSSYD